MAHLFIKPSLPPGMAALMNRTYVKEQIRALEADLYLCVTAVSEYICSGICHGSQKTTVGLPLQINTLERLAQVCFLNALGMYGGIITGILIPALNNVSSNERTQMENKPLIPLI